MSWLTDLVSLKFLTNYRTKIVGGGMILGGLATILGHIASVVGGEALNWELLQSAGMAIATGAGLLFASVHKTT